MQNNMRIRTQIVVGFLFVMVFTLMLAAVSVYYLGNLGKSSTEVLEQNHRSIKAAEEVIVSLSKLDQLLSKICLGSNYNDSSLYQILDNEQAILEKNLEVCKQYVSEAGEQKLVYRLGYEYSNYRVNMATFEETIDPAGLYFAVLQRQNEILRDLCANLIDINHDALSRKDQATQGLYFESKVIIFVITILVLICVGWATWKIPNLIVQPLAEFTEKIQRIAEGDYDQRITITSSTELSQLSFAFNTMSEQLKEYERLNIKQIHAQKSRLESVMKSLSDGMLILDESKEVILANASLAQITGLQEVEMIGEKAVDLALHNDVMREIVAAIQENERKESDRAPHNFLKVDSGEKNAFYAKEIYRVMDAEGESPSSLGYIVILKDITNFIESDEAKTNFIAVVSHELKTPLSALKMSLMLLQDDRIGNMNTEQERITESMRMEVQRLVNMVTELLDISRVEQGKINMERSPISPSDLVSYSVAPVKEKFRNKKVKLTTDIPASLPEVFIDPEKISWVLINFLNNALRYSQAGNEVALSVRKQEHAVEFAVTDEGPGIKKEDQDRIFDKFVQLNNARKKEKNSLGLGLAISKEVVEIHGGRIGVDHTYQRGSRFFFRIPLTDEQDESKALQVPLPLHKGALPEPAHRES